MVKLLSKRFLPRIYDCESAVIAAASKGGARSAVEDAVQKVCPCDKSQPIADATCWYSRAVLLIVDKPSGHSWAFLVSLQHLSLLFCGVISATPSEPG